MRADPTTAYHAYGDNDAVPTTARLADHVSVVRCGCGRVCLRFHTPATYTHGGRVFAVAYLERKDAANLGDEVLQALDFLRHNIPCGGH